MKRKSDFITNSSSTNYVVIETWEMVSGDIKIYKNRNRLESKDITKKFIDFVHGLNASYSINTFSIAKSDTHLQLAFGEDSEDSEDGNEISLGTGKGGDGMVLWDTCLTLNVYDDESFDCIFHYTAFEGSIMLNKAIDLLISGFIKILGITSEVEIRIERRVVECVGDGWDGGDPGFGGGPYSSSDYCMEDIECDRILTVNKGD